MKLWSGPWLLLLKISMSGNIEYRRMRCDRAGVFTLHGSRVFQFF
jgi:hypothetical protein